VPNYTEITLELQVELERIAQARDKLQKRLDSVLAAIKAIEVLAQESDDPIVEPPALSPSKELGFTDHIRALLSANPIKAFTAVDMRNALLDWKASPDADPKVMLIHVHNTLKRLFRQEEVLVVQMPDNRTGYKWKETKLAPIVDLMAALKESLNKMDKRITPAREPRSAMEHIIQNSRKRKEN
jgi:hypothetical protein